MNASTFPNMKQKLKRLNPTIIPTNNITICTSDYTFLSKDAQMVRLGTSDTYVIVGNWKTGMSIKDLQKMMQSGQIDPKKMFNPKPQEGAEEEKKVEEENEKEDENEAEKDIALLMREGKISEEEATALYEKHGNDFMEALMEINSTNKK